MNLLGDVLEAGEHLDHLAAEGLGDGCGHVGGDDGGDGGGVLGQLTALLLLGEDVVQQHAADLVAVEQAGRAVGGHAGDAHAVAVGVGAHAQIRAQLLLHLECQAERVALLRVGNAHGGEVAVRQLLLGNHVDVLHADLVKDAAHRDVAGAVQGGVDDLQILAHLAGQLGIDGQLLHGGDVGVVHILADVIEQSRVEGRLLVHGHGLGVGGLRDAVGDALDGLGRHLTAVGPVGLVAVVLLRVVAGGDHDARDALQVADREGQHRHRAQGFKQEHLHARSAEHQRGLLGEHVGHVAAVIGDGNALVLAVGGGEDVLGQRAGHAAHVVDIQAIGAGAQHAAHAGGAEFQFAVKAILDLCGIVLNGLQIGDGLRIVGEVGEPLLVNLHCFHGRILTFSSIHECGS